MGDCGVQIQRPVRLMAMQKNGNRDDRDMGHRQGDQDIAPPRRVYQPIEHEKAVPLLPIGVVVLWASCVRSDILSPSGEDLGVAIYRRILASAAVPVCQG